MIDLARLTPREIEVLEHVCNGLDGKRCARAMGLSLRTVDIHRANAVHKLGAYNLTHAAVLFDRARRADGSEAPAEAA